jgi:hypothetical protein
MPVHFVNINAILFSWMVSIAESREKVLVINNIIDSKSKLPTIVMVKINARVKLQSPILFTINACEAALQANDLSHQ